MAAQSRFSRRTRHPYRAESLAGLPDDLKQLAGQSLPPDDPIREIFIVPAQVVPLKLGGKGGMRNVPEQALLFTTRGALHVIGEGPAGQPPEATYMRGEDLFYTNLIVVLLYGRLELCSVVGGTLTRIVVEYNTVGQYLIQPGLLFLLHLVYKPVVSEQLPDQITSRLLGQLKGKSLKFRNGLANYALQPDERLFGYVYQPRIYQHFWRVLKRLLVPAGLLALTDRQLILIKEGRSSATSYGWNFTFCPRANITGIEIVPNGELMDLCVRLTKDAVTKDHLMTLDIETAKEWQAFWMSQA
jgi:hypothetical protein